MKAQLYQNYLYAYGFNLKLPCQSLIAATSANTKCHFCFAFSCDYVLHLYTVYAHCKWTQKSLLKMLDYP